MKWYLKVVKDNYANFNGRARRKEYWMFFLFNMLFTYGLSITLSIIAVASEMYSLASIYMLYSLAVLIPSIAVGVRRMHDVGKSGWYLLIPIYSFILAVTEGERGPNAYGPDPKNENIEEIDQIGQVQVD
ncbi:DUF805 domain-containing protein [Aestuariibaculum suncheonense]|uniref:DUF805 domain-containing protein n=1 Tax=Aestuariibaculum suncheonense TaxID=1028745 RepID=A0A8J6QPW1_9FLAO|nr:DUF805 domain-containing protein [Aestuariibaculum suncheonense]MBD0834429.1 DUF805 domain-containing protein [Aestuariibaculum suncheonense]